MKKFLAWVGVVAMAFVFVAPVQAVSEQITISQRVVSDDSVPPSVPTDVVAEADSVDQITVTWTASTDNVAVVGYQVFRDGTQVATSSGTTYVDSGLSPNTMYVYEITAYDSALNISARSASATATTLAPEVPTDDREGGGAPPRAQMVNFAIEAGTHAAKISWDTTRSTRSVIRWGLTSEYEVASLAENNFRKSHATNLSSLLPNTEYYFIVTAQDGYGRSYTFKKGTFVTASVPDTEAPPNVSNLRATYDNSTGVLTWVNPTVADFKEVRVIRKEGGVPRDSVDGTLVYIGKDQTFTDQNVSPDRGPVYYAVFARDAVGNESSGAVVLLPIPGTKPTGHLCTLLASTTVFHFRDIIFLQDGKELSYISDEVPINSGKSFTMRIPYSALPEQLKTILVTLTSPDSSQETFSFITRINADRTAYEATVGPLRFGGKVPMVVSVLNYDECTLVDVSGTLLATYRQEADERPGSLSERVASFISGVNYVPWILVLLLSLVIVWLLYERRAYRSGSGG